MSGGSIATTREAQDKRNAEFKRITGLRKSGASLDRLQDELASLGFSLSSLQAWRVPTQRVPPADRYIRRQGLGALILTTEPYRQPSGGEDARIGDWFVVWTDYPGMHNPPHTRLGLISKDLATLRRLRGLLDAEGASSSDAPAS